ncbi:MAG: autotransporter domain-containing protein [Candidatus Competibacterales bacterium]
MRVAFSGGADGIFLDQATAPAPFQGETTQAELNFFVNTELVAPFIAQNPANPSASLTVEVFSPGGTAFTAIDVGPLPIIVDGGINMPPLLSLDPDVVFLEPPDLVNGNAISTIIASDPEGGGVNLAITAGNVDTDGDGIPPFVVLFEGEIGINDADELPGNSYQLTITATDDQGFTTDAILQIDTPFTPEPTITLTPSIVTLGPDSLFNGNVVSQITVSDLPNLEDAILSGNEDEDQDGTSAFSLVGNEIRINDADELNDETIILTIIAIGDETIDATLTITILGFGTNPPLTDIDISLQGGIANNRLEAFYTLTNTDEGTFPQDAFEVSFYINTEPTLPGEFFLDSNDLTGPIPPGGSQSGSFSRSLDSLDTIFEPGFDYFFGICLENDVATPRCSQAPPLFFSQELSASVELTAVTTTETTLQTNYTIANTGEGTITLGDYDQVGLFLATTESITPGQQGEERLAQGLFPAPLPQGSQASGSFGVALDAIETPIVEGQSYFVAACLSGGLTPRCSEAVPVDLVPDPVPMPAITIDLGAPDVDPSAFQVAYTLTNSGNTTFTSAEYQDVVLYLTTSQAITPGQGGEESLDSNPFPSPLAPEAVANDTFTIPRSAIETPIVPDQNYFIGICLQGGELAPQCSEAVAIDLFDPITPPPAEPRLTLSKRALPTAVRPGDTLDFQLTVVNTGQSTAFGVRLEETLPNAANYRVTSPLACAGGRGSCTLDLGDIEPSGIVQVTLRGVVEACATNPTSIVNRAAVFLGSPSSDQSPSSLPAASAQAQARCEPLDSQLQLSKTFALADPDGAVNPGDTLSYTLTLSNTGQAIATGITLTDDLPGAFIPAEVDNGACTLTGNRVACDIADLSPSATLTATISGQIAPQCSGGVTNTAFATQTSGPDPAPASVTFQCQVINAPPTFTQAIQITQNGQTVDPSQVPPGQPLLFTTAATDPNDDPLTFVWQLNGGEFTTPGPSLNQTLDPALSGQTLTVTVIATDPGNLSASTTTTFTVATPLPTDSRFTRLRGNEINVVPISDEFNYAVLVTDDNDDPIPGIPITWALEALQTIVPGQTFTGVLQQNGQEGDTFTVVTDGAGVAAIDFFAGPTAATYRLTAAVDGEMGSQTLAFNIQVGSLISDALDEGTPEYAAAQALDSTCTALRVATSLSDGQAELLERCDEIQALAVEEDGDVSTVLRDVANEEVAIFNRLSQRINFQQLDNMENRFQDLRRRQKTPVDLDGFTLALQGQTVPLGALLAHYWVDPHLRVDQADAADGLADDPLTSPTGWGVFAEGNVTLGERDETDFESGFDFSAISLTLGTDYTFANGLSLGLAGGYSLDDADIDGDGGDVDVDGLNLTAFGVWLVDDLVSEGDLGYVTVAGIYGANDFDLERRISYTRTDGSQFTTRTTGDTTSDEFALQLGLGYQRLLGPGVETDFNARLRYTHTQVDGYREDGGDGLALELEDYDFDSLTLSLGVRVARPFSTRLFNRPTQLTPSFEVEWQREFEDDPITVESQLINGEDISGVDDVNNSLVFDTDGFETNVFRLGGGVSLWIPELSLQSNLNYQVDLGRDDEIRHRVNLGVRWDF